MSIEIVLVDSSQHTEKTLFYFLRPYTPVIHYFQNQDQISNLDIKTPPDIVFIDAEQAQSSPAWEKFQNQNSQTPVILLYKQMASLENKDSTTYQGKLQKPLNAKAVQDIVQKLVPKTLDLKLNPFLKFYPTEESQKSEQKISLEQEKASPDSNLFSQPIPIDGMIEDNKSSQDQKSIPLASMDNSSSPLTPLNKKEKPVQKELVEKKPIQKKEVSSSENNIQKQNSVSPDETPQDSSYLSSKTSTIHIPPEKKTSAQKEPKSPTSSPSLQSDIRKMIKVQFQEEWQTTIQKQISKDMETFIKSESDAIFKKHLDKILKDQISKIIKDEVKNILSKVLPNIVEYYLKKELSKEQQK